MKRPLSTRCCSRPWGYRREQDGQNSLHVWNSHTDERQCSSLSTPAPGTQECCWWREEAYDCAGPGGPRGHPHPHGHYPPAAQSPVVEKESKQHLTTLTAKDKLIHSVLQDSWSSYCGPRWLLDTAVMEWTKTPCVTVGEGIDE